MASNSDSLAIALDGITLSSVVINVGVDMSHEDISSVVSTLRRPRGPENHFTGLSSKFGL